MITVERYSKNAFDVQYQSHHLLEINHLLLDKNDFIERFINVCDNQFINKVLLEQYDKYHDFYVENYKDFEKGIWVFIEGYKNNQSLNHLKTKVPCFLAELPDDTEVYDVNLQEKILLSDSLCTCFGCYVPERSLANIQNIRRKDKILDISNQINR